MLCLIMIYFHRKGFPPVDQGTGDTIRGKYGQMLAHIKLR